MINLNLTDLQPITNQPALFIKKKQILVVADLHIGIERELRENGLNISSQTNLLLKKLIAIIKKYNPKKIILLGDVKHNIPTSTIQERKDVIFFIDNILSYAELHLFLGNHDGNIRKLLPSDVVLHPSDGDVIDDIGFIHGHRWPREEVMNCSHVIVAHTHPTVELTDRLGFKSYMSCWIRGDVFCNLSDRYPNMVSPKIVVMPAFNPYCGGIAVNVEQVIGPFNKILNVVDSEVFLLDGSYLGKLKNVG